MIQLQSCLGDHEPLFFDQEIENVLSAIDSTATWQLQSFSVNGENVPLESSCNLNHRFTFTRQPKFFEQMDIPPLCPLSGGQLGNGEWEVPQEPDFTNPRLILKFAGGAEQVFRIFEVSPARFKLSRRVIRGESETREEYLYVRVIPEN
jgi:hypothetical protein